MNPKIASKLAFGIGQKGNYDAISDVQQYMPGGARHADALRTRNNQSMTLDVDAGATKTSFGYMGKSQLKGMYSAKNRGPIGHGIDIKRNASVAVVHHGHAPKLFNSSRKGFANLENLNSTMDRESHRGLGSALKGAISGPKMFVEGISKSPSNAVVGSHTQLSGAKGQGQTLEFHRRNHSTVGQDFKGGLALDVAKGKQSLGAHRPSVGMAPGLGLKPKVSFDLPSARN